MSGGPRSASGNRALRVDEFEMSLRQQCDDAFDRPVSPDNPLRKLVHGQLSKEETCDFWIRYCWTRELIYNQITVPRLLELCPHVDARVQLWQSAYAEYGRGNLANSHPSMLRKFLMVLGASPERCGFNLDRDDAATRKTISDVESKSFVELMAYGFLGPATIAPKTYGIFVMSLATSLGVLEDDLRFFNARRERDQKAVETVLALMTRYARTAEDQMAVKRALAEYYDDPVSRLFCCALGPSEHSFVTEPLSARGRSLFPASESGSFRQRQIRWDVELPVEFEEETAGGAKGQGSITNISPTGALIRTNVIHVPGTSLQLRVKNPANNTELQVSARVIRTAFGETGTAVGFGVAFRSEEFLGVRIAEFMADVTVRRSS